MVSESSVQVQTAEASIGQVLDTKPIENLPLNGRNPLHLMALMPGVSGHASQATSSSGTVTFSVNGDREDVLAGGARYDVRREEPFVGGEEDAGQTV